MKLETLKAALTYYAQSAECIDRHDVFVALDECARLDERFESKSTFKDSVTVITSGTLLDMLNITTYDTYGKLAVAHGGRASFDSYAHACRTDLMFEELTNEQLLDGYGYIADLWSENQSTGDNKPDGTFNHTSTIEYKNLTAWLGRLLITAAEEKVAPSVAKEWSYNKLIEANINEQEASDLSDHIFELVDIVKAE